MSALALPAGATAQSRDQQQIFADLRILQEQVQQLRVAVNALAEQTKATNTRIDAQAEAARKNYADELQLVRELSASVEALGQKVQSNSAQVTKLSQELPPLRDGLNMLQQLISQVASQLQPMTPADPNASTGAAGATGAPPPAGGIAAARQRGDSAVARDVLERRDGLLRRRAVGSRGRGVQGLHPEISELA